MPSLNPVDTPLPVGIKVNVTLYDKTSLSDRRDTTIIAQIATSTGEKQTASYDI